MRIVKKQDVQTGLIMIMLSVLTPLGIWFLAKPFEGENWIYLILVLVLRPISILMAIPMFLAGISSLMPSKRKGKKDGKAEQIQNEELE